MVTRYLGSNESYLQLHTMLCTYYTGVTKPLEIVVNSTGFVENINGTGFVVNGVSNIRPS